ncbi:hypothetical protein DTO271G3_7700 [Paecilomyces variotii]|nr:hypothetical protein DTO271G3_7700 [Paecilomyces variotii]
MASSLWKHIGGQVTSDSLNENKGVLRALPASWYTSQEIFELERRAIFSRKWLLTTHKLRLPNAGDWLRYDVAGYQYVLVRDREGKINGFHNICRHRAFPVVTEEQGSSRIFSCKYHGWSYGLNGKLAKAPGYQDLEGFDKSQNGLLPIHVHIDHNGFIWVNLDSSEMPEISWEDDFKGIDIQSRSEDIKWNDYTFDHAWEMEGSCNWKILADNYNECYHRRTAHPVQSSEDLTGYSIDTKAGGIIHEAHSKAEQIASGLRTTSTYYFPNVSMTVSPHSFFMQRLVPISPTKSIMRYEVYRNKNSSDADFELINSIFKRIMSEDKHLCDLTQKNFNAGDLVNDEIYPRMEKRSFYFQGVVRDILVEHHQREEKAKKEIWPARQALPKTASVTEQDLQFCSNLACQTNSECRSNLAAQPAMNLAW